MTQLTPNSGEGIPMPITHPAHESVIAGPKPVMEYGVLPPGADESAAYETGPARGHFSAIAPIVEITNPDNYPQRGGEIKYPHTPTSQS